MLPAIMTRATWRWPASSRRAASPKIRPPEGGEATLDGREAHYAAVAANDVGGKLRPARLADRSRKTRQALSTPRTCQGTLARRPRVARTGAGRRYDHRHPRPGAGRPRHHHRRRDAARELL